MFKRALMPIFILIALAVTAWGQAETAELDIIIRDFSAPANSLRERQASGYDGYYGFQEFDYSKTDSSRTNPKQCNAGGATIGMVRDSLDYSQCSADERKGTTWEQRAANGRYCARPIPANPAPAKMCYGEYLQNWYTNVKEAKVIREIMTLRCNNNGLCEINDNAYFPLDKYPDSETWGKQNTTNGTTGTPHNYGFTVAGSGEFKYVAANNDNFAFKGDDDMWVFIDGVLVIDIGGVHNEVRDSIAMNDIARVRGWADGSMHTINFFYAERQTSSSHLRLTFRLTDLVPSQFGAPYIKKAETTVKDGKSETMIWVSTKLNLESVEKFIGSENFPIIIRKSDPAIKDVSGYKLSSIKFKEADGSNGYIYIIEGSECDSKTSCNLVISGGDSLSFNVKGGDLRDAGYTDTKGFTLPSDSWYIKSSIGVEATKVTWAPNSTQMKMDPFHPIPGDKNPVKPDFVTEWFTGNPSDGNCAVCRQLPPSGTFPKINQIWDPVLEKMVDASEDPNLSTNTTVRGFGKTGTPIPPQRAGELILTAFPNASGMVRTPNGTMTYAEWREDKEMQKLFGLPPEVSDYGPYGIADPKKQAENGGYAFVKNGFANESSVGSNGRIAPTRCIADSSKQDPRINCLNFSLLAKQPFQISVILYDQLGNFVTQYRETVSEKEFRSVVQGPNYAPEEQTNVGKINAIANKCEKPTAENFGKPNVLTTNGLVKVNVNIYPFSKDGRRFGNGVYIAKIDRVDLPYDGCMNDGMSQIYMHSDYMRYHAEQKFGWMRTKSSKK
ncbi:MAG: fibro-slime domain-containing protein [Fibromonadales bacterium]|nr:fibro-slime domain-containing protein [Fibromonadales bacterium]